MKLLSTYQSKGLVVVGPTQHYGYAAQGLAAAPAQETAHIDSVRKEFYSG